jgi:tetratricopeptide (TPR) repeat protein
MMTGNEAAFDEIWRKFAAGNESQALQELHDLANRVDDPWDKAWLKYQEIRFLVDMHNAPEARTCLEDLNRMLASVLSLPSSKHDPDAEIAPMIVRHAEIRVTTEEGRENEALKLIEDFVTRHPKQLSSPEFKALAEEVTTLRGLLLASTGRWEDARHVLENVTPPEAWKAQYCHYLGRCYYEAKDYERARSKLVEALDLGLDTPTEGRAHYVLGLVEYHLSDMKAAKQQLELSLKTADPTYLGEAIWEWLEATSRALGLQSEAENYRRLRAGPPPKSKMN